MKERPTCESCPYWGDPEEGDEGNFGFCQKSPPNSYPLGKTISTFPRAMTTDFCGEHPDFPAWVEAAKAFSKGLRDSIDRKMRNPGDTELILSDQVYIKPPDGSIEKGLGFVKGDPDAD